MKEKQTIPVFFDPGRKRWIYIKITTLLGAIILLAITSITLYSIINNPNLPAINFSAITKKKVTTLPIPKKQTTSHRERAFQKTKESLMSFLKQKPPKAAGPESPAQGKQLIGFFVNWDDASFTSLKQNINSLTEIVPEWLHLNSGEGEILLDRPDVQKGVLNFVAQRKPGLKIVPLINNFNSQTQNWDNEMLNLVLKTSETRQNLIENIKNYVVSSHLSGINIDFENVDEAGQTNLTQFMSQLYSTFHPLGLEVSQDVPLDNNAFNYKTLAENADLLVLMAYDEHWPESGPGPVASQNWYVNSLQKRALEIPAEKMIIALGNYGYDWTGKIKSAGYLSFQEALQTAKDSEGDINLDDASLNPTFDYYSDPKTIHHVWLLDAVTAFNQAVVGQRFAPQGFALWRLGSEDPDIWTVFTDRTKLDNQVAGTLSQIPYGYNIDYRGKGEILKVTSEPTGGKREIIFDSDLNLVTTEHVTGYPVSYTVQRLGGSDPRKIALTFDDGPDTQYTSEILDILKRYNVPATFFAVGINVDTNSEIAQREIGEGNEIGNHTFSHPNITMIPRSQFSLEVNTTERLFESRLGIHSLLFRPPYAEDVEPETVDQIRPLMFVSRLGYYVIGMQIDPGDWSKPGVDEIVNRTIAGAVGEKGNVVLLHDGGGDRRQTVAALPGIIEGLKSRGFKLVTISQLMGVARNEVMPPLTTKEWLTALFNDAAFRLMDLVNKIITYLFVVGIYLGIARLIFIGTLAIVQKNRKKNISADSFSPSVSAIVPAWNEGRVITKTIDALLSGSYKNLNIIIVDDGSTDKTLEVVTQKYLANPKVQIFSKPNSGKSETLNLGISKSGAEIIIMQDADTIVKPSAIEKLVAHFKDPRVAAVAGNAKVGNRINLLTKFQALEYITSQNLDRRAFDLLNCITVVPGAIGAWRSRLIVEAGGLKNDTLAEDADLTLRILRAGGRIKYEEDAVALTEAPDNIRAFLKQRFRWMFGTWQVAWKHKDALFRPKCKSLGFVALPNLFIFQILFPLISPIMDLVMVGTVALTYWQMLQHPEDNLTRNLWQVLIYYLLFLLVDYLAALLAFILEGKENRKLLVGLFFQRFFYRQLIYFVAVKSALTVLKGSLVGWGKLERKGTV